MLSAMDENTTNRVLDLEKKVACLEEEYCRRREEYERNWRFAVQLSYTLDKQLGDKLLEKSGCVNADKLLIFPCISAIQKAILKKRHYEDILDKQQKKVVEQCWNELQEELGWREEHYRMLKWLKEHGRPSTDDPEFNVADTKLSQDPTVANCCEELLKVYKKLHT